MCEANFAPNNPNNNDASVGASSASGNHSSANYSSADSGSYTSPDSGVGRFDLHNPC